MSEAPFRKRLTNKIRDIRHNWSARIFGSNYYEKEWANKDRDESYWDSRDHPHRDLLLTSISKYEPKSALEIGCNTGPNLYRLSKKFPNAILRGIDVSEKAIEEGKAQFEKSQIKNVILEVGKADNLSSFEDKTFDVVFCDAVLIYVGRDKIERIRDEMIRVAKKAVVLVEWHDEKSNPYGKFLYKRGYWVRDYVSLFKERRRVLDVILQKITRDIWDDDCWAEYGRIIEVPLKDD